MAMKQSSASSEPDGSGQARSGRAAPPSARRAVGVVQVLRRGVPLAVVWLLLAGAGYEQLVLGVLLVPVATWLGLHLLPVGPSLKLWPVLSLLPHFVLRSLIGGVDVAWRAFHPRVPVRPGWVALPVTLPAGGRVALGVELSLMPGTLVAGTEGDRLLIHVLDRDQDVLATSRNEETRLARVVSPDRPAGDTRTQRPGARHPAVVQEPTGTIDRTPAGLYAAEDDHRPGLPPHPKPGSRG